MEEDKQEYEPTVLSNDPEERKLARRLRIERRWNAFQKVQTDEPDVPPEEPKTPLQIQVQRSAELLEKFLQEGDEYITNVRVANDAREVDRRELEGIGREKVISELENEAALAQQMFDEIATKWSTIQKYNDPLHIHEDILNQKDKCDLLIKQKDEIIAMLRNEIKNSERKFSKDQLKQKEDINKLAQRIEKQMVFMRHAHKTELELIEQVMLSERQKTIEKNDKRWEELYKKREDMEIENVTEKFQQLEEFNEKMRGLREKFESDFRETKIELENDAAELQQEFENIKALALLNKEKLDYNYQILKKREDENLLIKSQQKRRLNKLHDVINDLKTKIVDYEKSSLNRISKLKENIVNMKQQINEIEAKADHFAKVNDNKFHEIWDMNQKECQEVLEKILVVDRILYEQQMGIEWEPPATSLIKKTALKTYRSAVISISDLNGEKASTSTIGNTKSEDLEPDEADLKNKTYIHLLKHILAQITDKSSFLSEKRLKVILKPYISEHQQLVKLDNVFLSLDICKKEDIDMLVKYFLPYSYCMICKGTGVMLDENLSAMKFMATGSRMSASMLFMGAKSDHLDMFDLDDAFLAVQQPEDVIDKIVTDLVNTESFADKEEEKQQENQDICGVSLSEHYSGEIKQKFASKRIGGTKEKLQCQYNHPMFIPSSYILVGIRDFVADYYKSLMNYPTMNERLARRRNTISRLLSTSDIKLFWSKYAIICDSKRIKIWEALFDGLKNFHEILKHRKMLCEEVIALRKQNQELKRLLANYIDAEVLMQPVCDIEGNTALLEAKCLNGNKKCP